MAERSYYCSMKFKYIKIDLVNNNTYTCYAAKAQPINFSSIEQQNNKLFNSDINIKERSMMLNNERCPSCENACWPAEDRGIPSPRLRNNGQIVTHTEIDLSPEIIEIVSVNDCNLTCSYCCKEFSSAWAREIETNGNYNQIDLNDSRYQITPKDKALFKLSQSNKQATSKFRILDKEIRTYASELNRITVTGGEPLLDNNLHDWLTSLPLKDDCQVMIFTGLGLSQSRFQKSIEKLSSIKNVLFFVSAENIGKFAEFNRYGIQWDEFLKKLDFLNQHTNKWKFHCTLSNLSIFGFNDFINSFSDKEKNLEFVNWPPFMKPSLIDPESKEQLIDQFRQSNSTYKTKLINAISPLPDLKDRANAAIFLTEFVRRRPNVSLDIFPASFLKWLDI